MATRSLSTSTYVELSTGGTVRYKGYLSLSYNGAVPPTSPATPSLIITPDLVQGLNGILDGKADSATYLKKGVYYGYLATLTTGTAYTVPPGNLNSYLTVNPAATLDTLPITLPTGQLSSFVYIAFGGTKATGTVVKNLFISAPTGQTVLQTNNPLRAEAGEFIAYRFNAANATWYRVATTRQEVVERINGQFRGPWLASTTYDKGDQVTSGGNSYRAKVDFTSGGTFDATKWDIIAQGGGPSDGTVTPIKTTFIVSGKNLFNPAAPGVVDGAYLENTNIHTVSSQYGYTDYIPVTPGLQYTGWDGITAMRKTTFFDAGKNYIAGGSVNTVTTFTVPAGVAYVRVSYYVARKSTFQFEQAAAATSFEVYGNKFSGVKTDPSSINQDPSNRFASDTEKTTWNAKLDKSGVVTVMAGATKNLFNPANVIEGSYIDRTNGNIVTVTGWQRTGNIACTAGLFYAVSGLITNTSKAVRFENASGTYIGLFDIFTNGPVFQVPAGATQMSVTLKRTDETLNLNTVQIEQNNVATGYIAYNAGVKTLQSVDGGILPVTDADKVNWNGKLDKSAIVSAVIGATRNLFNPSAVGVVDGYYLETTNIPTISSSYGYTDFIPVTPGLQYTGWDGITAMRKTCYFDANKALIAGGSANTVTTFTVPAGVYFVRVSYYTGRKSTFQFEQSASATAYVAYKAGVKTLQSVDGAIIPQVSNATETKVTLKDIERVIFFADSYTDGPYQLKGKGYLSVLSQFSDWNFENYAKSGDTFAMILARMQSDNPYFHSSLGIKGVSGGGYGFILSWTNEFSNNPINTANQLTIYLANLKLLCDAVKAQGLKPVICTEYYTGNGTYGYLVQSALSEFCSRYGYLFVDIAQKASLIRGASDNPLFWYGSHPGVRTNSVFWSPLLPYIHALSRPKRSLKVYVKRASYTQSSIADFLYTGDSYRAKMFREIYVSQHAITSAYENYFDDLTTMKNAGQTGGTSLANDYMKLLNGEPVSMDDYALVETVVNANAGNISTFGLGMADVSATVYVRDWVNNAWVLLTPTTATGGVIYYLTNVRNQVSYDKASFLVYKSSAWNLTNPYYVWSGTSGKDLDQRALPVDLTTAQLLTNPAIDASVTGWTKTGTVTAITPDNVPLGATKAAVVDASNYLSQSVSFTAETIRTRKVQVKLYARRNPAPYASSNTYPAGSPITSDTYDFARLGLDVQYNANNILYFDRQVGLHWTECLVEFQLPPNISTLTFTVKSRDVSFEFSLADVRVAP